jgi:hypothetical protein
MGDAGEGLVDAEAKAAERMAEREQESRRREDRAAATLNPEHDRMVRSLQLARAELTRQAEATQNERRKEQIRQALADIETKLATATPQRKG